MFEQSIAMVTAVSARGQVIMNPRYTAAAAEQIPDSLIYESCRKAQLTTPGIPAWGINSEWDDLFFHQYPLSFHPWATPDNSKPSFLVLYVAPCNSQTTGHGCLAKSNAVSAAVSLVLVLIYEE